MGRYINITSNGVALPSHNKAAQLIEDGAKVIPTPTEWTENLVCVVENGMFDAAAYAYSESEMKAFSEPSDFRPRTWLVYEHAENLAE